MSNIVKYDYKRLTPFKWFVLENFPFIEADFDAITNYQLFCKVVEYLNKTIDSMNQTGEVVEEFTQKFIDFTENINNLYNELKSYVDNYFTNLDVQEEINNKLDEMAENGKLLELLSNSFLVFNTVDEMINSNRLNDGMVAYTLGYYEKNDGGNGKYIITSNQEELTQGFLKINNKELYAKLMLDNINILTLGVKSNIEDTINFQNAIDFCKNNQIDCLVPSKTFIINNTLNLYSQYKLILKNNAKITSNSNVDMINMPWGSMIEGGIIENTNTEFNKSIIILNSSNYLVDNKNGFIKNITLVGSSQNCNGIRTKYSENNSGISYFTFDDIFIKGCGYALKITDDENANNNSYFTANLINNLRTFVCNNNIYINLPSECGGNNFKNIQIQPPASYSSALFLNSSKYLGCQYNIFEMMVWDTPSGLVPFQLGNNTGSNIIYSYAYNELLNNETTETRIKDEGKDNLFITGNNFSYYINSLEKFSELDLSNLSNEIAYPVLFENLINITLDMNNIGGQSLHFKLENVPAQDGYRKPYYNAIMSSYYNDTKRNLVKVENKSNSKYTVLYLIGGFKYRLINYNAGRSIYNQFIKINPQIIDTSFIDGNNVYTPISATNLKSIKNGHYMGFTNINLDENSTPLTLS